MSYIARAFRAMPALRNPARGTRPRSRSVNAPYRPGTLGVSSVSEAIHRDYGAILSRRERRQLARRGGPAFRPYYNDVR
jgi:hypothetical protein